LFDEKEKEKNIMQWIAKPVELRLVYLAKIKNSKDEKQTIAIAKTPGHRKIRKVM